MSSQPRSAFAADRLWAQVPLDRDEVHVWFVLVDEVVPLLGSFVATLASDEIARAKRFRFPRDRDRYVLARGLLREILSRYRRTHPRDLRFCYGARGKPRLSGERGDQRLSFNLSHAQGAVVCAVACGREIGVDLEYASGDIDDRKLAERYFSPREASALGSLPPGLRQRAFLTCWTRKEAYVKAKGEGLSLDLRSFDVLAAGDPAPTLQIENDPEEAARWSLADLDAPAGYVAALVIEGHAHRVCYGQWG